MPEQRLHSRQIGPSLQQMRREAMTKQMRAHGFGNARWLRRFPAGLHNIFGVVIVTHKESGQVVCGVEMRQNRLPEAPGFGGFLQYSLYRAPGRFIPGALE